MLQILTVNEGVTMSDNIKTKSLKELADEAGQIACGQMSLEQLRKAFERLSGRDPFVGIDHAFTFTPPSNDPDEIFKRNPDKYYKMKDDMVKKSRFYEAPKQEVTQSDDESCYDWFEGKPK